MSKNLPLSRQGMSPASTESVPWSKQLVFPTLTPVEHDPMGYASPENPIPVDYDPFAHVQASMEPNPWNHPMTPEDINPNSKVSLGTLYRGTESGPNEMQAATRFMVGGDLGNGIYTTQDQKLAGSYGGGPSARVGRGRTVHTFDIPPQFPEDVGYVFGGMGQNDPVKIVSGNGIPLYEGPWTGGTGKHIGEMENALNGIKVVIGTPNSVGVNQISIRDPSILRLRKNATP